MCDALLAPHEDAKCGHRHVTAGIPAYGTTTDHTPTNSMPGMSCPSREAMPGGRALESKACLSHGVKLKGRFVMFRLPGFSNPTAAESYASWVILHGGNRSCIALASLTELTVAAGFAFQEAQTVCVC